MYRKILLASASSKMPDSEAIFLMQDRKRLPSGYRALDTASGGVIRRVMRRGEFSAAIGVVTITYAEAGDRRIFIVGLGETDAFGGNHLRRAAARLCRAAFAANVAALRLNPMPGIELQLSAEAAGAALADGFSIASFDFDSFRGAAHRNAKNKPLALRLQVDNPLRKALTQGLIIGQGLTTSRTLAASPPNVANPRYIANHCRKLARRVGLKCSVIDATRAAQLGMGGLIAVGRAGSTPPVLICLQWPGRASGTAPILLVGKAITFDTGGYSLKTGGSMKGMKYDKCGGMAVIGAMESIARLKLPKRVIGLIPCAENMIDESAYRVDDILTLCNGVTVEVTNTDAEGRLILADALAYGTRRYRPQAVIDLATLTGGVVVALGSFCAGLFCNDDGLRHKVEAAAEATGERVWRLPLWQDHRELMRGNHSDLINASAVREAHPIQGAAFLSHFVGKQAPITMPNIPWAHLDIAGVADRETDSPLYPKGPTGFGVRLLSQLIANW